MTARVIVFDIETYRTRRTDVLERVAHEAATKTCAKSASKQDKLEWDMEGAREERVREAIGRTAVDPMLAEVLCCGLMVGDGAPRCYGQWSGSIDRAGSADERGLMSFLAELMSIETDEATIWVGHNIEGFDLPVLLNAWRRHGLKVPRGFPSFARGRWHGRVFDTMQRAPARTPFVGLEALCEAYGVPLVGTMWRDQWMDGSRVAEAYEAGEFEVIDAYCLNDVRPTRALYDRMTCNGTYGTWEESAGVRERLQEIEENTELSEGQRALAQKALLIAAGRWGR